MSGLILGTAQLGQRYGIANRTGQPDSETASAIVRTAWERGIHGFDTAPSYGTSEQILGASLAALGVRATARVTSKLDAIPDGALQCGGVRSVLAMSRERLGVSTLDAVFVRRTLLPQWDVIVPALRDARDAGEIRAIGVSVYEPEEALAAIALPDVRVLQLPANVLDHRFADAGVFRAAADHHVHIHIRSAFLQGLMLMDAASVPMALAAIRGPLARFAALAETAGCARIALALGWLRHQYPSADVVVGAEVPAQVAELADAWNVVLPPAALAAIPMECRTSDATILNPHQWPTRTRV